jgi:hypothetical protein
MSDGDPSVKTPSCQGLAKQETRRKAYAKRIEGRKLFTARGYHRDATPAGATAVVRFVADVPKDRDAEVGIDRRGLIATRPL